MCIARNKKRCEHRSMCLTPIAQSMICITSKKISNTHTEARGWNEQYAQQSKVKIAGS